MKKTGYSAIVLIIPLLLFGCTTSRDTAPPIPAQTEPTATPAQTEPAAVDESGEADMATALSQAIDDRSKWDSLHLHVSCSADAGTRSAEVYGNGVGIWDYRRQFTLTPGEISDLLKTLDKAKFTRFADVYGGRKKPDPRPPEKEEDTGSAIRVICRVVLSIDGQTKQVAQLGKGEQSAEFKQMAEDLLAICEKMGQTGVAAADLNEGLEKVSRGDLAPEAFQVLLHHKPKSMETEDGFLLRLSGSHVTTRGYDPAASLLDPLSLTLSPAEVADLARELASLNLPELPINLFAQDYTDLTVDVLNHKKSVQARQFGNMTSTTHGERQLDFERIYNALHQLHVRVLSEGEPVEGASG